MKPVRFHLDQSMETLTAHSGLALIGLLLSHTRIAKRLISNRLPGVHNPTVTHPDVLYAYLGLLCQGKSDFDHIEPFREDVFFAKALGLKHTPSSPTLRQRLDLAAAVTYDWQTILLEESANLLRSLEVPLTPVTVTSGGGQALSWLPLDLDVSPFDNGFTKKEGVSRTYKGTDGYSPFFAYLGQEGYGVNVNLREGSTHVQKEAAAFLLHSIEYSRRLTGKPLLVRMDAGNDAIENLNVCLNEQVDFIIKRNLRRESPEEWLAIAKQDGMCCEERDGKRVYLGAMTWTDKKLVRSIRAVYRVTERTIEADGQILLTPIVEAEVYWTTLVCAPSQIVGLYRDHATSEQFHSELKTDLNLERLPSGKFATNDLVLCAGLFAYNLLRAIGQISLQAPDAPVKTKVTRRRVRTVIENLIWLASRLVQHARETKLRFGRHSPWFPTFHRIYLALSG
jgi:hypothetical protein